VIQTRKGHYIPVVALEWKSASIWLDLSQSEAVILPGKTYHI
jgi:hypothetical protein